MQAAVLVSGIEATVVSIAVSAGNKLVVKGLSERSETAIRVQMSLGAIGHTLNRDRAEVTITGAEGSPTAALDLPVALAVIGMGGDGVWAIGELALNGDVRPVRGALQAIEAARDAGAKRIFVPWDNAGEAKLVGGIEAVPVYHLRDAVEGIGAAAEPKTVEEQVAAAITDGKNILIVGPLGGTPKTTIIRTATMNLPRLSRKEQLEVARAFSAAGLGLATDRPVRAPHYSASYDAILGDFNRIGEATLANHGVLILDELPEFRRSTIESLGRALKNGSVTYLSRKGSVTYPTKPVIVATMTSCPCGHKGSKTRKCKCTKEKLEFYQDRIEPLMGMFQVVIHVEG